MNQWLKRFFNARRVVPDSSGDGSSHSESPKIVKDFVRIAAEVKNGKRDISIEDAFEAGDKCILDRRYQEAVEKFKQVIAMDKNYARAYAYCGRAHRKLGQYEEARVNFARALNLGYLRPWIVTALEDLHNVHKKEIKRYYNAGMKYIRARRYQKAVKCFSQIFDLDSNDARAVIYRGAAYLRWKQEDKARIDFKRLLDGGYSQPWIKQELKRVSPADER